MKAAMLGGVRQTMARDCVRTERVACHEHRRGIPEKDHLGGAAAHQVDRAGLYAGKNINDAILTGASHKLGDAICDPHGDGIVCCAPLAIKSCLAPQRSVRAG
jgi:hypothetical protein